jgi:DNA repair protein RadC
MYEAHDRSLMKLAGFVRGSALPACQRLATGLQLAQELLAEELVMAPAFDSPNAVVNYMKLHFAGQTHESFVVLCLSAQHHLLGCEAMFRGTLTQTSVYPREVIKQALHYNAAAVILAHNHPSGSTEASRADEVLTRTLSTALALVDVRVLDHLITAGGRSLSMAEHGLI